jgi:leader peptidase (prepilin peptidase)/N-methyltransferase
MIAPAPLAILALAASPFVGSFVGLVADRLPRGETMLLGRSACRDCGATLGARDLVPVLSWLVLRGKCRGCGAAIGWLPPAAELGGLLVALSAVLILPEGLILPSCLLGWCLLALALIDRAHLLLPDRLTLPLAFAGLGVQGWWLERLPLDGLLGIVVGGLSLTMVALLYRAIRRRDGLGWGDVKLFAAGGAWVGWAGLPSVLLLAALIGIAAALATSLKTGLSAAAKLPFGPALAAAIWIVWLCGPLLLGAP